MGKGEAEEGWSTFACPKLTGVRQALLRFWFVALRVENLSIPACSSCSYEQETVSQFCASGGTYQRFALRDLSIILKRLLLVDLTYSSITVAPTTCSFTRGTSQSFGS